MDADILEKYGRARSISDAVVLYARPLLKDGAAALDIAEKIEAKIESAGGGIAFPVNVSINENAAHYTPSADDTLRLAHGDLVKIDTGVHVDGYIWDRAFTVCIGQHAHPLISAAEKALAEAIKLIRPGTKVMDISEVVDSTITGLGFNPVRNLCGHGLEQYTQHAALSIPNGRNTIRDELKPGQAVAMEVFATDGVGWIRDSRPVEIFAYVRDKPARMWEARRVLDAAKSTFNGLPFAKRWLRGLKPAMPAVKVDMALGQLLSAGALRDYPVLREESGGRVAQAEETILLPG
ncbi:MAG: type II methionyl aminopeptidase [Candidatus Aenigmatarchaeota archaeon]